MAVGMLMCNISTARAQNSHTLPEPLASHYVRLKQGEEATYREAYREADSLFATVIIESPEYPAGYLMRAAALHAEMVDHERYNRAEEFLGLLEQAEERAKTWAEAHPDDPWGYCFLGHAYGYRAVWEAQRGSWFKGLRLGLKAKGAYHDALKADSTCWDAYLGLGSYHYWKSARTEFINWLGVIVKDDKERGIEEIQLALEKGIFCKPAAAVALIWIDLDRGRAGEARDLAAQWQAIYPEGKTFLWGEAFAELELGASDSALVHFDSLHNRIAADTAQSYFNPIEIDSHRANLLHHAGRTEHACALMDTVLSYPASREVQKRQKKRLKEARKFVKEFCPEAVRR